MADVDRAEGAPTLATVAAEAGVSRQTVSNALNSPDLLRPDTLERVQEAIETARLLAQPGGPQPAHPLLAPDRAARRARGGGQRQRADGPVPALPGREQPARPGYHVLLFTAERRRSKRPARTGTTSCCAPPPSTPSWSPTPTAATRRRPGWRSAGAVRGLRPALGRARAPAPLGRRRRRAGRRARGRPPRRAGAPADRLGRLAEGLLHRRGPAQRLGRPDARPRAARPAGSAPAATTPSSSARRAAHALLDAASSRPRSCAPATPSRWACCRRCDERGLRPGRRRGGGRLRRLARRPGRARRG